MKVSIPCCPHPKCGARMFRLYRRVEGKFIPCAWMCLECGMMQKD